MLVISARIAGFILLFVLVSGKLFNAYLFQGGDHDYVAEDSHINIPKKEASTRIENNIRGRKIMSDHGSRKIETTNEIVLRAKDSRKSRILISKEDYQGRFVAFNADYKGPRHHPPKNN